jgi:hypothetical protein
MARRPEPKPGSSLPPGFRRLGDAPTVVHQPRLPAWLVGLIIAAVIFTVVLVGSRLLGFGDDPVVDEGIAMVGWRLAGRQALTDSTPLR